MRKAFTPVILIILLLFSMKAAWAVSELHGESADYQIWLKRYGAYDVLQRSLADQAGNSSALLERARAYLEMNDARSVLALLGGEGPLEDNDAESERLLLMARAHRLLGDMSSALRAYSRAGRVLESTGRIQSLRDEPGVNEFWSDVWRTWVWDLIHSPTVDDPLSLQHEIEQTLDQALVLWPKDDSWFRMAQAWRKLNEGDQDVPKGFAIEPVSSSDQRALARILAYVALGQWTRASSEIDQFVSRAQAAFWSAIIDFARDGRLPEQAMDDHFNKFLKAGAFLNDKLTTHPDLMADNWRINEPTLPSWQAFSGQLASVEPRGALDIIERESKSMLLSSETMQSLRQMSLAYAILVGDAERIKTALAQADRAGLLVSLKLGALLTTNENTFDVSELGARRDLAAAVGIDVGGSAVQAPFWIALEDEASRSEAIKTWPLDDLLLLGYLKRAWQKEPSPELAKRMGLLFPGTPSGMEAILALAEDAGKAGLFGLSATYLALVDVQSLSPNSRAAYLQSKARLEIELGREDKALGTYEELLSLDRSRLSPMQKLQLALLAQQRGRLQLTEELLADLWSNRAKLEPSMQAEVLFYQAEVDHSSGRLQEALDTYLRLAYLYPEQNIWAVTALYRAALIYESAGRYDSAKRLLTTVIKNAARKSQKEAAEERLKVVESKLASEQRNVEGRLYPF